jgi:hypothetical protein
VNVRRDKNISYVGEKLLGILLISLLFPATAIASDYTGFFFLFLEIPILVLTCLFLTICFFAPKAGLVLLALLLFGIVFVLAWASDVGYMSTGGGLILLSLAMDIGGVFFAIKKIKHTKELEPKENT